MSTCGQPFSPNLPKQSPAPKTYLLQNKLSQSVHNKVRATFYKPKKGKQSINHEPQSQARQTLLLPPGPGLSVETPPSSSAASRWRRRRRRRRNRRQADPEAGSASGSGGHGSAHGVFGFGLEVSVRDLRLDLSHSHRGSRWTRVCNVPS